MAHVEFDFKNTDLTHQPNRGGDIMKGQKRQVKTVILHRSNTNEDWGLKLSGKGWQDGEWMRTLMLYYSSIYRCTNRLHIKVI